MNLPTIKDAYVCPNCHANTSRILAMQNLLSDVRYDIVQCSDCGTEWRVYYRVAELNQEVTYVPQPPVMEPQEDVNVKVDSSDSPKKTKNKAE